LSLRLKLVVMILFVALVPLAVSTITVQQIHEQAFDEKVGEIHRASARSGAALVGMRLDNALSTVSQAARSIAWPELTDAEREGALWLIYRQLDEIAVVSLLDGRGEGIGSSAYLGEKSDADELARHPVAELKTLQAFAEHIPFQEALDQGDSVGLAFVSPGAEDPLVPLAVTVPGKGESGKWVVVVGLSLETVCAEIGAMGSDETQVLLVDGGERIVCRSGTGEPLAAVDPALADGLPVDAVADERFHDGSGEEWLATLAPATRSWCVVVQQPVAAAFASTRTMRYQSLFWLLISIVVAVTTGLLLGRGISKPVERLARGAEALAAGELDHRLPAGGGDELGKLSRAFNHMGEEIAKRDAEIRAWNEELQQRVEEQTKELRSVEDQLLQSQKIAAVTSLGAGIAHEINNPLASVLGMAQLLLAKIGEQGGREQEKELLQIIEKEAHRIRKVVKTLKSFSEDYAGKKFAELELNLVIEETVEIMEQSLSDEQIEVVRDLDPDLPPLLGNRSQLQQVLLQLLKNAWIAMPRGGAITLITSSIEDRVVKLTVADTGKGIAPENLDKIFEPFFTTKDDWHGEGLGLTVAYRIVEEHHGKIEVISTEGEGTTFTIVLPAAKRGAHLI